ncbi:MAG: chromate transporter [Acidocella sp.]|nr:chromate transporter [Acidocella sp.]
MTNILVTLTLIFGKLSLLAVGGINSTLPEIAAEIVTSRHWLSPAQFSQLYAISNAAPGPNVLITTLIGAHMAGVTGGIIATLAMILPAGILVVIVSQVWETYREARWRRIIQAALLPVTAGLILAAAGVLVRQADTGFTLTATTLLVAILAWRSNLHPLWLLGGGALVGLILGT